MERKTTKKALEIAEQLETKTREKIVIYKGSPDASSSNQYWAVAKTWNGFASTGKYGVVISTSSTLVGLLTELEECTWNI